MNCLELMNGFTDYYIYEKGIGDRHALDERYSSGTLMRWNDNYRGKLILDKINIESNQHIDVLLVDSNCNNGFNHSRKHETNSICSNRSKESFSDFYALKSDQTRLGKCHRSIPKYKQRISAFEFTSDQSSQSYTPSLSNQTTSDLINQVNNRINKSCNHLKAKICQNNDTSESKHLRNPIKSNYKSSNKHNSKVSDIISKFSENSGTSNDIISSFEEEEEQGEGAKEQDGISQSHCTNNLTHTINDEICNSEQQLNSLTLRSQCSSCTTTTTLSETFDDTTCSYSVGNEINDIYNGGPSLRRVRYIGTKLPTHKWHRSCSLSHNKLRNEIDIAYLSLENRKCYIRHYVKKAIPSIHNNIPLNVLTNKSIGVYKIAEKRTVSDDYHGFRTSLPSRQNLSGVDINTAIQVCSPKRLISINETKQSIISNESEGHIFKEAFPGHDIQPYFIATCINKPSCDTFSQLLESTSLKTEHPELISSEKQKFNLNSYEQQTLIETGGLAETMPRKSLHLNTPEKLVNIMLMKNPVLTNSVVNKPVLKNSELSLNSTDKSFELDTKSEETPSEQIRPGFIEDSEISQTSPSTLFIRNPEETNIKTIFTAPEYTHLLSSLLHLYDTDRSEVRHSIHFTYLNDGPSESHGDSPRNTISNLLNIVDNTNLLTPRTCSVDSELTCLTSSDMLPDSYFSKHSQSQSQEDRDFSQSVETMTSISKGEICSKYQLPSLTKEIFEDCEKIVYLLFSNLFTTPDKYVVPIHRHIFPEKCIYFEQILFGDVNITSNQSLHDDKTIKEEILKESLTPRLAGIQIFAPTAVNKLKQKITDIQEICSFNKTLNDTDFYKTHETPKISLKILKSGIFDSHDIKKLMSLKRTSFTEISGFNYMDYPIFKEHFDKLTTLSKLRNESSLNIFCNISENFIDLSSQTSPISTMTIATTTTTTTTAKQQVKVSKDKEHSSSQGRPIKGRMINKQLINLCDSINVNDLRYGDAIVSSCQSSKYQLSFNDQNVISSIVVGRKVLETPSSLDRINKPKLNKTACSPSLIKPDTLKSRQMLDQKAYKPVKSLNRITNASPTHQMRRNKQGYEHSTVAASVLHNKVRHLSSNRSVYSSRPKKLPPSNMTNRVRKPPIKTNIHHGKQDSKSQYGPLYFSYFMNDLHLSGSEDHDKKEDTSLNVLDTSKKTIKKASQSGSSNEPNNVLHETMKSTNINPVVTNNSKSMNLIPPRDIVAVSTKRTLDKQLDKMIDTEKYIPSLKEISEMNRPFRRTNTSPSLRYKIKYPHGKINETHTQCSKGIIEEDLKEQTENLISSINNETIYDKRMDVCPRTFSPIVSPTISVSVHYSQRKSEDRQEITGEAYDFKKTEFWCCGIWRRSKSHSP